MSNKVMRTIYFSKDIDDYIRGRMGIEDRKRSALVERLIKKCIAMEKDKDIEIAMAVIEEPLQS